MLTWGLCGFILGRLYLQALRGFEESPKGKHPCREGWEGRESLIPQDALRSQEPPQSCLQACRAPFFGSPTAIPHCPWTWLPSQEWRPSLNLRAWSQGRAQRRVPPLCPLVCPCSCPRSLFAVEQ